MATPFAGERIRIAREIHGLTQEKIETDTGFSQSILSEVERGQRAATDELVAAVAKITDLPIEFFEVRTPEVPLDSLRFRKQSMASAITTKRARSLFREAFRVSSGLVDSVGYHRPDLPVAQGDLDDAAIIELAAAARQALQIDPDEPARHVLRTMERAGIPITPLVLPGVSGDGTSRHFGLSYWAGPGEHALVSYFPGSQGDRDRFTLAHELGHLVLHSKRQADDPETEANLFAGEFLMPRHKALEILGPTLNLRDYARLKSIWGISIQALVMRAKKVGAITDERSTSLFKQISARGWRKLEPVESIPEQPALLARLLSSQYGNVPSSTISAGIALSPMLMRSLIPPESAGATGGKVLSFPSGDLN